MTVRLHTQTDRDTTHTETGLKFVTDNTVPKLWADDVRQQGSRSPGARILVDLSFARPAKHTQINNQEHIDKTEKKTENADGIHLCSHSYYIIESKAKRKKKKKTSPVSC